MNSASLAVTSVQVIRSETMLQKQSIKTRQQVIGRYQALEMIQKGDLTRIHITYNTKYEDLNSTS